MTQPRTADPDRADRADGDWWRDAVVYQVYPRTFADSNGDGIGDLVGITRRVDHFARLGVDAVWINPFYPSPLADGGYDIRDHVGVDERIGTLEQFDDLVAALHRAGLRLIVDIVPNHTSNEHPWFQEALAAPRGSVARSRFHFLDGTAPDQPPSDWVSSFGGSAWTRTPDGQWYLHLFAPEQPDWNWANPEIRDHFLEILRFWADRGVDGFRIDVAQALTKDMRLPLPSKTSVHHADTPADGTDPLFDRDELDDVYRSWRRLFDEYDPPRSAVAEAFVPPSRRARYADQRSLGQVFNFDLLEAGWDAPTFLALIQDNLDTALSAGSAPTWVLSNHDVVRHATRFGLPSGTDLNAWLLSDGRHPEEDIALGLQRARAALGLLLALPGSVYLYQGEELGLREVATIPARLLTDPTWLRSERTRKGRDGARVPLPWTPDALPAGPGIPEWYRDLAASRQAVDPSSTLAFYRRAIALRRSLFGRDDAVTWAVDESPGTICFERAGVLVRTEFSVAGGVSDSAGALLDSGVGDAVVHARTIWSR